MRAIALDERALPGGSSTDASSKASLEPPVESSPSSAHRCSASRRRTESSVGISPTTAHIAVAFDRAAGCRDSALPTITTPATGIDRRRERFERQQRVIDGAEAAARDDERGQADQAPSGRPSSRGSLIGTSTPPAPSTIHGRSPGRAVDMPSERRQCRCGSPAQLRPPDAATRDAAAGRRRPARRPGSQPDSRRTSAVSSSCSMPVWTGFQ